MSIQPGKCRRGRRDGVDPELAALLQEHLTNFKQPGLIIDIEYVIQGKMLR